MAAKSIVEIDVQDEKFQSFLENSMNTRKHSANYLNNGGGRFTDSARPQRRPNVSGMVRWGLQKRSLMALRR
ncbi:Uncharacterised protein [Salmonella enterica subsp. enterica]|uniref:Uncharacterized protein n=1 Tax=Salmonella enterica I TaxID=59201 RepID=A0A379W836_SALET|nr:Uncharacterised protein [Salmonella enterica subsp. enterica]